MKTIVAGIRQCERREDFIVDMVVDGAQQFVRLRLVLPKLETFELLNEEFANAYEDTELPQKIARLAYRVYRGESLVFPLEVSVCQSGGPLSSSTHCNIADTGALHMTTLKDAPAENIQSGSVGHSPAQGGLFSGTGTTQTILANLSDQVSWRVKHPREGKYLIRSERELMELLAQHGGADDDVPRVDFTKEMVVVITLDEGSYERAPQIEQIQQIGDEIRISYRFFARPWKMINPRAVIRIPRMEGTPIFVEVSP